MGKQDLSFNSLVSLGKTKSKDFTPTGVLFNGKDFEKGMKLVSESLAEDFTTFVNTRYLKRSPNLRALENVFGLEKHTLSQHKLLNAVKRQHQIVFIQDENVVGKLGYEEIWYVIEYGRKDKNIFPSSILRSSFKDFFPIYRKTVERVLLQSKKQ